MFKKENEIKKKVTVKVYKRPMFLIAGLIALIAVMIAIYMIFLNFKEIMRIEYDGYAISGKEITENLLGNSSEENKSLSLILVKEQDKLYKKLNSYFIGENKKDEINLEYPIYINNNSTMYNLSQNMMLITNGFEELAGYPNLTATNGAIYNQSDLERMDNTEYFFLKNKDNVYTSLKEIKIATVTNEYIIPLNSSIYFDKEAIRYYEIKNNRLIFEEIGDIDYNSKVQIGDKEVNYQELLTKLKILKEEKQGKDIEEEIIKEDTSKENQTKNEEVKRQETEETNKEEEKEVVEGKYIKPTVTCSPFEAKVYTMSTELQIQDPSKVIQGVITFEIKRDGRVYLRKTYTSSGGIQIVGLEPNTKYEIEGTYIYLNEQGQKVENTFYEDSVTTKGLQELKPISLSFENGEIFDNKVQIAKLKISSSITEEAVKGIKRAEVIIGNASYEIKLEKLKQIIDGHEIVYETSEGLKSNSEITYEIKLYDKQGNQIKLENNRGKTKTAKQKPNVTMRIAKQNIIDVTLGIKLNNKDRVEIQNYRYVIIKPNGDIVKENGLKEEDNEIFLDNLDPNQYYSIKIYGNYDVNNNKGIQENQMIGETIFATQPLSVLGYVNLEVEQEEVTTNRGNITVKINEEKTDIRLIQILKELKIQVINKGKNDKGIEEQTKENDIISETILEGEELQKLKQGGKREESYENLNSNTKYEIKIIAKVSLGDTIEEIQTTYDLKEFITLKQPPEIQMRNLFVTGDMIDFDVRIEDIDHASLTKKVRMELRDEKLNLVNIEYINTNEIYGRKTFEKLELNKTYTLSFYADQYNEGSTDSTYKANYLLKQIEIYTETGITGSIGLTDLTKKATGKNLIDMSSETKWYSPCFDGSSYYRKEYQEENRTLILGGKIAKQYVYDLRDYIGRTVTMSFKGKLVGSAGNGVYIQNSKFDKNRIRIEGINSKEWKEFSYTVTIDETGYLGFFIWNGDGIGIQELQVELGDKKTPYQNYEYQLTSEIEINLKDRKNEITTNDYYISIYEDNNLILEERYQEIGTENIVNTVKQYKLQRQKNYKVELKIKIRERSYILDQIEFKTENDTEIKGIKNEEEYLDIQPKGNYIILNNLDFSEGDSRKYQFGTDGLTFNGKIDYNGKTVEITYLANMYLFTRISREGEIENIVLNVEMPEATTVHWGDGAFFSTNYGTINNIQVNLTKSEPYQNIYNSLVGWQNYGSISNIVINYEKPLYGNYYTCAFGQNFGEIQDGYIYGESVIQIGEVNEGRGISTTPFLVTNGSSGIVRNIYTVTGVDFQEDNKGVNSVADLIIENSGIAENIYSVNTKAIKESRKKIQGPNIYKSSGSIQNSYYFYEDVFSKSFDISTSKLALYDVSFQEQTLNSNGKFQIEENIKNGYFPQLEMSEVMPKQPYIKLPEVKNEDLPEIISSNIIEKNNDSATLEVNVHNPSGETITNIEIQYVTTEIASQEFLEGKSKVILKIKNPTRYLSKYQVIRLATKGVYGLPYERKYKENEKVILLDLYREIYNISQWKEINLLSTENYKLMADLDFSNEGKDCLISNPYTGVLDGGNHTIRNLRIEGIDSGLIKYLRGTVKNLYIDNFNQIINTKSSYAGVISDTNNISEIDNVHVQNAKIELGSSSEIYAGILVGLGRGKIQNCSVQNGNVSTISEVNRLDLGGLVGNSNATIRNSYVLDIELEINKALIVNGIGGLVGTNTGIIQYSYSEGKIKTAKENTGGIVGSNQEIVRNNYSKMDIETTSIYAGGIAGFNGKSGDAGIVNNLYIGNLYSSGNIKNRMVGNDILGSGNYGYKEQSINGEKKEDSAIVLLNRQEIFSENTYEKLLFFENNFDYQELNQNILPKVYYQGTNSILPNQKDIKLETKELEIEKIQEEKLDVNTGNIAIVVKNETEYPIRSIIIDDMEVEILKNINQSGKTYIELKTKAVKYYDSYKISHIVYEKEGKEESIEVEGKINLQFFKDITKYEEWQEIDGESAQNYRLLTDIDFSGKVNPNYNVSIGRLEAPEEGHTIKNLDIVVQQSKGLIKELKISMKHIHFENITIQNLTSGQYEGVILNNTAEIEDISFKNTTIKAPNMNFVACISKNVSNHVDKIQLESITCQGNSYVASFISNMSESSCMNIEGRDIEINATGDYVGGIFGNIACPNYSVNQLTRNIFIENSNVVGRNYVGGAIGAGRIYNVTSKHNTVKGGTYVGGVSGNSGVNSRYAYADFVEVSGSGSCIGGVVGYKNSLLYGRITNSIVEGTTASSNSVGGFAGGSARIFHAIEVNNTRVISKGNNVGTFIGQTDAGNNTSLYECYAKDCYVEGNSNIGGLVGCVQEGNIWNNYTNTEVVALGDNVGGIAGYIKNQNTTNISDNEIKIYKNNVAGSKITGNNNIGGLIGKTDKELYLASQFVDNYIEAYMTGKDLNTMSLGIGSNKQYNEKLNNMHVYQYSSLNGENPNQENDNLLNAGFLVEQDLKQTSTYQTKLKWDTSTWNFDLVNQGKYPILRNNNLTNQEGIDLPKDSEHMLDSENSISLMSMKEEKVPLEAFEYEGKDIEVYENYSIIQSSSEEVVKREDRLYVKDGKLYVIDGSLPMVANNLIIDSYNGKEYETILGTDGKIYDLKEKLHYPENFKNTDIVKMTNNLHTEYKITTVTYADGSSVQFNYQTGEILNETKTENDTSIIEYLKEQLERGSNLIENTTESYEENKNLISKLQTTPIEKAIELKNTNTQSASNIESNDDKTGEIENSSNQANGITSTDRESYITVYNSSKEEFEVYKVEEILNAEEMEVISENEKIEKNNLSEYYTIETTERKNLSGMIWIVLSITGVVVILGILWRRKNV